MRLTRRERAAMELCLHVLRSDVRRYYDRVPTWGDLCSYLEILEWGSYGLTESMHPVPYYDGTPRLMYRARLALYLRARLRADRGDCGPLDVERRIWRDPHGERWSEYLRSMDGTRVDLRAAAGGARNVGPIADFIADGWRPPSRRITPLWETSR